MRTILCAAILFVILMIAKFGLRVEITNQIHIPEDFMEFMEEYHKKKQKDSLDHVWNTMYEALIVVESRGDSLAINSQSGAAGIIQIMPVYVDECNRLLGEEVYTLEDRFIPSKCREMFDIIQAHYNPNKDVKKAAQLHNPNAGEWYWKRIYNNMLNLTQDV